jgi:hypothetical protein
MMADERAVTPAVTHAMTIGISTILITGLLIGAGQLMDDQQSYVVEGGLENVGGAITSELVRVDQFDKTGVDSDITLTASHPSKVGGQTYDIILDPGSDETTLHLNATDQSELTVLTRFDNETAVCPSVVDGGTVVVAYNVSASCLELRERP